MVVVEYEDLQQRESDKVAMNKESSWISRGGEEEEEGEKGRIIIYIESRSLGNWNVQVYAIKSG